MKKEITIIAATMRMKLVIKDASGYFLRSSFCSFLMILSSIDMYTPIRLKSNKILLVDIKEWQAARKIIFEYGFLYNLYLW